LDFSKFQGLKPHLLDEVDKMLTNDIADLIAMIPLQEANNIDLKNKDSEPQTVIEGLSWSHISYINKIIKKPFLCENAYCYFSYLQVVYFLLFKIKKVHLDIREEKVLMLEKVKLVG
jgi:hypothetical protein